MNNCLRCNTETKNPYFCTKSCSASYHNKANPKRKPENFCARCRIPIPTRRTYCDPCKPDYDAQTLGEVKYSNGPNNYRAVRDRAKNKYKDEATECQACSYPKHVEICHIKSISSFGDDTPIGVINDRSNIMFLCPNCHWELDHGVLLIYPAT